MWLPFLRTTKEGTHKGCPYGGEVAGCHNESISEFRNHSALWPDGSTSAAARWMIGLGAP